MSRIIPFLVVVAFCFSPVFAEEEEDGGDFVGNEIEMEAKELKDEFKAVLEEVKEERESLETEEAEGDAPAELIDLYKKFRASRTEYLKARENIAKKGLEKAYNSESDIEDGFALQRKLEMVDLEWDLVKSRGLEIAITTKELELFVSEEGDGSEKLKGFVEKAKKQAAEIMETNKAILALRKKQAEQETGLDYLIQKVEEGLEEIEEDDEELE